MVEICSIQVEGSVKSFSRNHEDMVNFKGEGLSGTVLITSSIINVMKYNVL